MAFFSQRNGLGTNFSQLLPASPSLLFLSVLLAAIAFTAYQIFKNQDKLSNRFAETDEQVPMQTNTNLCS